MWRFKNIPLKDVLLLADYGLRKGWSDRIPWHSGIDVSIGDYNPVPSFVDDTAKVYKVNPVVVDEGTVILDDVNNYEYVFAHLDKVQVKEGQLVKSGEIIGYQDSKGQSVQAELRPYWSHLHFGIRKINPQGKNAKWWNYGTKV
jgi:murein DD-endopeptidase MepM/ murein hydrolase activator NlpD